jgi:FkbM family methyltransferase
MPEIVQTPEGWTVLHGDQFHSKLVFETQRIDCDFCGSLEFIQPYLTPGSVAIDVGAHIGNFTIFMMRMVGRNGLVIAVEPTPVIFACLERNIRKEYRDSVQSANCLPLQIALGDKMGQANFVTNHNHWSTSSLCGNAPDGSGYENINVEVQKLDQLAWLVGERPVSMIKIDVEGSEIDVVIGAQEFIRRKRPVMFIETLPPAFAARGITRDDLEDAVTRLGYRVEYFPQAWVQAGHHPHDMLAVPL